MRDSTLALWLRPIVGTAALKAADGRPRAKLPLPLVETEEAAYNPLPVAPSERALADRAMPGALSRA